MTSSTTGPWNYNRESAQVDSPTGTICSEIGWRANGELIAAAPDLLAALNGVLSADPNHMGEYMNAMSAGRAAVAKARGTEAP